MKNAFNLVIVRQFDWLHHNLFNSPRIQKNISKVVIFSARRSLTVFKMTEAYLTRIVQLHADLLRARKADKINYLTFIHFATSLTTAPHLAEYLFQSPQKSPWWRKRISDFLRDDCFLPHSTVLRGHIFKNHQQRLSTQLFSTYTTALLPLVALDHSRRKPFKEAVIRFHGVLRCISLHLKRKWCFSNKNWTRVFIFM